MGSSLLPHPAVLESLLTEQFRLMVRQPLTSSFRLFRQILGLEFGYFLLVREHRAVERILVY